MTASRSNGRRICRFFFRLVWFGTPSDVTTEANDGRGPVDYKIARGASDKTLVEMKLAKNTALERNLERQVPFIWLRAMRMRVSRQSSFSRLMKSGVQLVFSTSWAYLITRISS